MSPFILRPGLQALPTPYIVSHSRTAAFAVPAPRAALQKVLDDTLNAVAGTKRFEPLLDCILLTFIHYPNVHAQQAGVPAAQQTGYFAYEECAVFLLLKDNDGSGIGTCWHVPMILLNSGIPMILGREVYGFPKVMGRVDARPLEMDDWVTNPTGTLKVSTSGFQVAGPTQVAGFVDVAQVTIKHSIFAVPDKPGLFHLDPLDLVQLAVDAIGETSHIAPVFDFFQKLMTIGFPGIFLKELPGGDGTQTAVYRRLLKSGFTPTGLGAMNFVLADVTLFDPFSYPLASTFGITPAAAKTAIGILADISWELPAPIEL